MASAASSGDASRGGVDRIRQHARHAVIGSGAVILALLVFAGVKAAVHYDVRAAAHPARSMHLATGTALPNPPRVPSVLLTDAQGRRVSLAHWSGRWIVLAPSMTLCGEVCPMTTGALLTLRNQLVHAGLENRVVVIEATVDPWRDTPYRLRAYRRLIGADFPMLTGTPAAIQHLWRFFGVDYRRVPEGTPPAIDWLTHRPERFDIEHTDGLFIISPTGRERVVTVGMPNVGGHLSRPLRGLLDPQGRHDLAHPQLPWTASEVFDDLQDLIHPGGQTTPSAAAPSRRAAARLLAGSAAPLAALHRQAGQLLRSSIQARLRKLRGFPVVVNAWASWCTACRAEMSVLAQTAALFGRRVAFLGLDVEDSHASADAFLRAHPLSYPSYAASSRLIGALGVLGGLPTTMFIGRNGKVVDNHLGSYESENSLAIDIQRYFSVTASKQ